jgi:exodeoxyribonuclease V gamma subunit
MLEAILSARDRLLLLWSGHDVQQGKDKPAAVPVEELLEVLAELTGRTREELVREHPLQPWSAGNFVGEAAGFDEGMALASHRLWEIEAGEAEAVVLGIAGDGAELPEEAVLPTSLPLQELADALLSPHKLLLRDRLGLSVSSEEAAVEDREPLEFDHLEAWGLRNRVVGCLLDDPGGWTDAGLTSALRARLGGEGILPLMAGGSVILTTEVAKARRVLENLAAIDGTPTDGLELSVQVADGPQLVGRVDDVLQRGDELLLQWSTSSSSPNERTQLIAWLHLLAAKAAGHSVVGARLVGYDSTPKVKAAGGDFLVIGGSVEEARAQLQTLVDVWRAARNRALPLFRMTSSLAGRSLADVGGDLTAEGARAKLTGAVAKGWGGTQYTRGD